MSQDLEYFVTFSSTVLTGPHNFTAIFMAYSVLATYFSIFNFQFSSFLFENSNYFH